MFRADTCIRTFVKLPTFQRGRIMKENRNESLTKADLQTILDHITVSTRKVENYVNAELTHTNNKVDALQTGVSNLKADVSNLKTDVGSLKTDVSNLKKDMTQVKTDVSEMKTDVKQVKEDVDIITSDYGYKRDQKGKLKLT